MHCNYKMPQIREYMTRVPVCVQHDTPLEQVDALMRAHDIRHVPVTDGGRLVGVLSERNLRAALVSGGKTFQARDAMIPDPYVTPDHTALEEVTALMAQEKYGSVIVENEEGKVVGIFTTVDVCRALTQLLERTCSHE